jgi:hypothetical protein
MLAKCITFILDLVVNIQTTECLGIVFTGITKDFLELVGIVKLFPNLGCCF